MVLDANGLATFYLLSPGPRCLSMLTPGPTLARDSPPDDTASRAFDHRPRKYAAPTVAPAANFTKLTSLRIPECGQSVQGSRVPNCPLSAGTERGDSPGKMGKPCKNHLKEHEESPAHSGRDSPHIRSRVHFRMPDFSPTPGRGELPPDRRLLRKERAGSGSSSPG